MQIFTVAAMDGQTNGQVDLQKGRQATMCSYNLPQAMELCDDMQQVKPIA